MKPQKQVNPNIGKGLRGQKMKAHRASTCITLKYDENMNRYRSVTGAFMKTPVGM
jgi:hypothetical protein